jgi:hypothetical protein
MHLWAFQRTTDIFCIMSKGTSPCPRRAEVPQGTLDLRILKTPRAPGTVHGFGMARRIEQMSWEQIPGVIGRVLRLEGQQ